jgi:hypothetical protein
VFSSKIKTGKRAKSKKKFKERKKKDLLWEGSENYTLHPRSEIYQRLLAKYQALSLVKLISHTVFKGLKMRQGIFWLAPFQAMSFNLKNKNKIPLPCWSLPSDQHGSGIFFLENLVKRR